MSISTRSLFYYGFTVTDDNKYLTWNEGSTDIIAELSVGSYTLNDFVNEIERVLNAAGNLSYTVSVNRTTRIITITGSAIFSLLVASGSVGNCFTLMGYTGADRTGLNTYAGNAVAGLEYKPQFVLQSFVDKSMNQNAVESTVMTSADGTVEVVKFGNSKFYEFNIKFVTDTAPGGPIETNANAVSGLISLMEYLITKAPIELMLNRATPGTFDKVILEKTPDSDKGVGFKLKEMYDRGLPGFYETGTLKMRVIN